MCFCGSFYESEKNGIKEIFYKYLLSGKWTIAQKVNNLEKIMHVNIKMVRKGTSIIYLYLKEGNGQNTLALMEYDLIKNEYSPECKIEINGINQGGLTLFDDSVLYDGNSVVWIILEVKYDENKYTHYKVKYEENKTEISKIDEEKCRYEKFIGKSDGSGNIIVYVNLKMKIFKHKYDYKKKEWDRAELDISAINFSGSEITLSIIDKLIVAQKVSKEIEIFEIKKEKALLAKWSEIEDNEIKFKIISDDFDCNLLNRKR